MPELIHLRPPSHPHEVSDRIPDGPARTASFAGAQTLRRALCHSGARSRQSGHCRLHRESLASRVGGSLRIFPTGRALSTCPAGSPPSELPAGRVLDARRGGLALHATQTYNRFQRPGRGRALRSATTPHVTLGCPVVSCRTAICRFVKNSKSGRTAIKTLTRVSEAAQEKVRAYIDAAAGVRQSLAITVFLIIVVPLVSGEGIQAGAAQSLCASAVLSAVRMAR